MSEETNKLQERTSLAGDAPQEEAAPGLTGAGDAAEPFEPIDRVEFRRGLNDIHRGILETDARGKTNRKLDELRDSAALVLIVLGFWAMFLGWSVKRSGR